MTVAAGWSGTACSPSISHCSPRARPEHSIHQYYETKVRKDFTITEKAPIIVCYGCQRGADNNLCNILIDCL